MFAIHPLAQATSLYVRPFSEFTQTAPNMVRGKIDAIHVENGLTEDGGKTIYTFADVSVIEVIKGNLNQQNIKIRRLGGTKDGMTLDVPSSVQFNEGDENVFFLSATNPDGSFSVIGMQMGKFGLREENGEMILTGGIFSMPQDDSHDEHDHLPGETPHEDTNRLAENRRPWTLQQLKTLVQSQPDANQDPAIHNPVTASQQSNTSHSAPNDLQNRNDESLGVGNDPDASTEASPNETDWVNVAQIILGALSVLFIIFYFKRKKLIP